jgi:hypothetical protein
LTKYEHVDLGHKALLFSASVGLKCFLMAIVASAVFCGGIDPNNLFRNCYNNVAYVGASVGAIAVMGIVFGYYIIRLKPFDSIFAKVIKADFIVTAMYFGAAFIAPATISGRVMIWLFGIWILGILLAPFDKERTRLKKIIEYGAIIALGIILAIELMPRFEVFQQSSTLGMLLSSIFSVFGAGRQK